MKEKLELNPLLIVQDVLVETAKSQSTAEVVLLALKLVKCNPEVDELTLLLLARHEWTLENKNK